MSSQDTVRLLASCGSVDGSMVFDLSPSILRFLTSELDIILLSSFLACLDREVEGRETRWSRVNEPLDGKAMLGYWFSRSQRAGLRYVFARDSFGKWWRSIWLVYYFVDLFAFFTCWSVVDLGGKQVFVPCPSAHLTNGEWVQGEGILKDLFGGERAEGRTILIKNVPGSPQKHMPVRCQSYSLATGSATGCLVHPLSPSNQTRANKSKQEHALPLRFTGCGW